MRTIELDIPNDVSDEEARLMVAIRLLQEGRISAGRAAEMSGYSRRAFMEILAHRGVPVVFYSPADLTEDLKNA